MKNNLSPALTLSLVILFIGSALAGEPAEQSTNNRWGIRTKNPISDESGQSPGHIEKKTDPTNPVSSNSETSNGARPQDPALATGKPPTETTGKAAEAKPTAEETADGKPEVKTSETPDAVKQTIQDPATGSENPGRPWIIKKEHLNPGIAPEPKAVRIEWRDESQKNLCEANLKQLRDNFLKARYASVHGDSCLTADHAHQFIFLTEKCERECPDQYLEQNGYTQRIIRNLRWLEKLGSEQCLGTGKPSAADGKN